jgi:non-specific serine/threonine protein kinase
MRVERVEHGPNRLDLALPERDNFRAALDWSVEHDPELGVRIMVELEQFFVSVDPDEGRRRLSDLFDRVTALPPELEAAGLRVWGGTTQVAGDRPGAERLYLQSLEAYERLGDEWGVVHLRHRLWSIAFETEQWERARAIVEENLVRARALGSRFLEVEALGGIAAGDMHDGNVERARDGFREHVELSRELGFNWFVALGGGSLAECELELGRIDEAEDSARAALALTRQMDDRRLTAWMLLVLAVAAARRGDEDRAGRLWGAAEAERNRGALLNLEWDFANLGPKVPHGDAGFEAGRAAGRRLSLDEAAAEALAQRAT